ncbi:hypothetical protein C5E43_22920 [Nocardia cyriacigeorgica]|nr:hypothetical protein C5B73_02710 [Nocardia cyriacigeorgica]PPJ04775.1 hypothetical protein C5E43_22920 [Nocardia cyriacigeorgica]
MQIPFLNVMRITEMTICLIKRTATCGASLCDDQVVLALRVDGRWNETMGKLNGPKGFRSLLHPLVSGTVRADSREGVSMKKLVAGVALTIGLVGVGPALAPSIAVAGPCQPGVSTDCKDTKKKPPCQPGVTKDCKVPSRR